MKREQTAYLPYIIVAIAFGVISVLVYLSLGKQKNLIAAKIKLGALLLSLGAVSSGCGPMVSCYDPAMPEEANQMFVDLEYLEGHYLVDSTQQIPGRVEFRKGVDFSYHFIDIDGNSIHKGNINALDGNFDQQTESFEIPFTDSLNVGYYDLELHATSANDIDNSEVRSRYRLKVL